MRLLATDGSLAVFSFGGVAARGVVAVGGVQATGVVAVAGVLPVGLVAIGMNAAGAIVALGMNCVGLGAVAAINGLGGLVWAGVNGLGVHAHAYVNSGSSPFAGVVVAAVLGAIGLKLPWTRAPRDPEPPSRPLAELARVRRSGWARARLADVSAAGDGRIATLVDGGERAVLPLAPDAVASAEGLLGAFGKKPPRVLARLDVRDVPVGGAAVGYREAPPSEERLEIVELRLPPSRGLRDGADLSWLMGWGVRAAAAGALAMTWLAVMR